MTLDEILELEAEHEWTSCLCPFEIIVRLITTRLLN